MKKDFKRKVLKNGMTVLFEKRRLPVVSVAFAARQGGINESAEEKGLSHFIEHMLYKGTKKRSALDISSEIEKKGGILNGFTDEMLTGYWCKMPSEHLKTALDVLGDMVKNSVFDEKELEKERKVIFEEIKMRRDNPMTYVHDKIQGFLYGSPFGRDLIGTEKTMNSIDKKKIVENFKEIYQPNNLVLCVVGDADFEKIVEFAEKNFGDGKGKIKNFEVVEKIHSDVEERKGIDQANLVLGFHTPKSGDKNSYAAEVLVSLMAKGGSSRLFKEIREERGLAYGVGGHVDSTKDFGCCNIYVGTSKENVEKVKKLILEEFKKVGEGIEEKEVEMTKTQLIGHWKISMEESVSQMDSLLRAEIEEGDSSGFYDYEKNINSVKLEDVKKIALNVKEGSYSFFALVPE